MGLDTPAFRGLLEASRDGHADAMREVKASLGRLTDIAHERAGDEVDTDEIDRYDVRRRRILAGVGGGLVAGILGAVWASPARADTALDVRILQTASSLEALAVATYDLALGEGPGAADAPAARALAAIPVTSTRDALLTFARETRRQHDEHRKAFQAQTKALDPDAAVQDAPNPKFLPLVTTADLSTPDKLVDFAAVLEKVATDSYLLNLTMLQDTRTKAVMGSVMGSRPSTWPPSGSSVPCSPAARPSSSPSRCPCPP